MAEVIPLTRVRTRGLTIDRSRLEPTTGAPQEIYVLFTGFAETLSARQGGQPTGERAGGGVTVIHFRPIGFLMPLDHPSGLSPVETDAFKARLAAEDCDARVRVCLCRDPRAGDSIRHRPAFAGRHRGAARLVADAVGPLATDARRGRLCRRVRDGRRSGRDSPIEQPAALEGGLPCLTCSTSPSASSDSSRSGAIVKLCDRV